MWRFKRLPKRRGILWLLNIVISVPVLIALLEAIFLTSPPRFLPQQNPHDFGINNYETVEFRTADGLLLRGWYVVPRRDDGASILFVHGQAGNKGQLLNEAEWFHSMGYGLLLFDSRGRGESEGDLTTLSLLETQDVVAAFEFLSQQEDVNPERIGIYGHSMGGASSIQAMTQLSNARVLMLDAPFADLYDTIRGDMAYFRVPPLFFPDLILTAGTLRTGLNLYEARPVEVISEIIQPIFLMHGTNDITVPLAHAYWLYDEIQSPKFLYIAEGASHTQVYEHHPETFQSALLPFLQRYLVNETEIIDSPEH